MLPVSIKCLTPIGTGDFLRRHQITKFANIIVSLNLSPDTQECQGSLHCLDEGYSGTVTFSCEAGLESNQPSLEQEDRAGPKRVGQKKTMKFT